MKVETELTDEQIEGAAQIFAMGSDVTRLKILGFLATGPKFVGEICTRVTLSPPGTSCHLAKLRHTGMVRVERKGKQHFYGLTAKGRALAGVAGKVV